MDIGTLITLYILVWIIPCMVIASAKNKSVGKAFVASVLFGVFALIYYIFAAREEHSESQEGTTTHTYTCEKCGANVLESDKFCPECGDSLDETEGENKCPKCSHTNKDGAKHCASCGHKLKEVKAEQQSCTYCGEEFRTEELLDKHLDSCKERIKKKDKEKAIVYWVVWIFGALIFANILNGWMKMFVNNYWWVVPFIAIVFITSPFFNQVTNKILFERIRHKKKRNFTLGKRAILAGAILLVYLLLVIFIPNCPKTCDDGNTCTSDWCNRGTGYKCQNQTIMNCRGNGICEQGEYPSADCPSCDDGVVCTKDTIDYTTFACNHEEFKPCVGNRVCEQGEYGTKDCPNCDDSNKCTADDYNHQTKRCTHSLLSPCCGDKKCELTETYVTCPDDCSIYSAELSIDKTSVVMRNLYPVRVTIKNTGGREFEPKFDIAVTNGVGTKICEGSDLSSDFLFEKIKPGETKTGEVTFMGCMLDKNGLYNMKLDLLTKEDYKVLTTTETVFEVNDPLNSQMEQLQDIYNSLN